MNWPRNNTARGFALPTILISSVIMMTVLVTATTMTEAMHATLDRQYYNQLAREAAESGMAMAKMCLQKNGYMSSWSDSYPLQPDRDCTGMNSNDVSHRIVNQNNVRTTFSVANPSSGSVSQKVTATGTAQLLRESTNLPWRTFTYDTSLNMGIDLNLNTVAFGGVMGIGSYFGTIAADNTVRMVGSNWWGQLGNGTYNDTLTPTRFQLNDADIPVGIFTNSHLTGYNVFALTNQGEVWGAGHNGYGQLGNGTMTSTSNPVKFNLPTGKTAQYVVPSGLNTYVLTTDGNIYSTGQCAYGILGYNYLINGCVDQSTYHRVNLPSVTTDPNTIPTTNITTDVRSATFVRMQGGKVYGWGHLSDMVASGAFDTSNPVQIGSFGNTGQPTARQIFTDSDSLWIVDSNGTLWGMGTNEFGQLGGQDIEIYYWLGNKCLDNQYSNGTVLWLYACNGTSAQKFTFQTDGTIYNSAKNVCVENINHSSDNFSPLGLRACDGTAAQKWLMQNDGSLINTAYNVCIDDGNGTDLRLYACIRGGYQYWQLSNQARLVRFNLPSQAGTAVKVWADKWFVVVLTSNGQIWGAGLNDQGQLGNGTSRTFQPYPVQFILPNGVTATDVYATCSDYPDHAYCGTFVIGSNGKVYGAGSNAYGQLGDGTTVTRSTPVPMQVIDGTANRASQVMSGYGTTVIFTSNHKVFTVGNNSNGQLGDGTTQNSLTPKANKYTNVLPVMNF